ncbi:MAG: cellulase family glycosylhydrolase [Candidatus Aminicenantes bacterium]|nr:cellulase family glycosylhydrolase [Candidatus Aminicenantes bacterium]
MAYLKTIGFCGIVLFLLTIAVYSDIDRILFQDKEYFVFGINLPWLDGQFDHDIGPNSQHPEWGVAYNREHFKAYFSDMKAMGAHFVRIWLWENAEGLLFDNKGYVSGIHEIMWNNLDDLMALAEEENLPIYWCLISGLTGIDEKKSVSVYSGKNIFPYKNLGELEFQLGHAGNMTYKERLYSIQQKISYIPLGIRYTPLANLLILTEARQSYIENALIPFIKRYAGNPNIFAIDIMNEPEADIAGERGNWSDDGVDWSSMRLFIGQCARAIHSTDPTRLVSCGSGWHNEKNVRDGYYRNLGLDFYDFHVYRDDGWLPSFWSFKLDGPCLIGEYGQKTNVWDDSLQNTAYTLLMNNAWSNDFAGCLVWDYNYPGATEIHTLIRSNGQWRPVCYSLQAFDAAHGQDTHGMPTWGLKADFTFKPHLGFAPLCVQFINQSKGRISSFLWEFGDGMTSYEESPVHIYLTEGEYWPRLTIIGVDGTTVRRSRYIKVLDPYRFIRRKKPKDWKKKEER